MNSGKFNVGTVVLLATMTAWAGCSGNGDPGLDEGSWQDTVDVSLPDSNGGDTVDAVEPNDSTDTMDPDAVTDVPGTDGGEDADATPADTGFDATPDGLVATPFQPPACGTPSTEWVGLIPGPGQEGYDAELEAKATRIERAHQIFVTAGLDCNKDISIDLENTADRQAIEDFLQESDSWDFKDYYGKEPLEVITTNHKVAGLYAGVGIAANAYRYGVLRNQGYPCQEVERARQYLLASLDALHLAQELTGTPGVIARGFQRNDIPHNEVETVELFDGDGNPLPAVKNNGTWRRDLSGLHPEYAWEDSVSRDMYIGWVKAQAAAWEVIRDDDSIPAAFKDRLKADALLLAKELMVVRCHEEYAPDCYDLEIPDADGRTTFHGWLNPQNFDGQFYLPGGENGFHAVMALGIVAAFAFITEDPEVVAWLNDDLIGTREFDRIVVEHGWELFQLQHGLRRAVAVHALPGQLAGAAAPSELHRQRVLRQARLRQAGGRDWLQLLRFHIRDRGRRVPRMGPGLARLRHGRRRPRDADAEGIPRRPVLGLRIDPVPRSGVHAGRTGSGSVRMQPRGRAEPERAWLRRAKWRPDRRTADSDEAAWPVQLSLEVKPVQAEPRGQRIRAASFRRFQDRLLDGPMGPSMIILPGS